MGKTAAEVAADAAAGKPDAAVEQPVHPLEAKVNEWWQTHIAGSVATTDTAITNHLLAAKQSLINLLKGV